MTTSGNSYISLSKPTKKYSAIYADPPWYFRNFSKKGEGRNAVSHYDCMSVEDICALPVQKVCNKDCVLFLWTTDPLLPSALRVIDAWGFKFKTVGFYWAKTNKTADLNCLSERDFFCGLGYWTRANVEQCLLATKGSPKRLARNIRRLVVSQRREHSRKPDEIYGRIENLVRGPYLELFARDSNQGWDAWGNQEGLFDDGSVQTRRQPSSLAEEPKSQILLPLEARRIVSR